MIVAVYTLSDDHPVGERQQRGRSVAAHCFPITLGSRMILSATWCTCFVSRISIVAGPRVTHGPDRSRRTRSGA
jgi:hypothetical protein